MKETPRGKPIVARGDRCPRCGEGRVGQQDGTRFELACPECGARIAKECMCQFDKDHCQGCGFYLDCRRFKLGTGRRPAEEAE